MDDRACECGTGDGAGTAVVSPDPGTSASSSRRLWQERLPLLLKGPTGYGKTRLVEFMDGAARAPARHGCVSRRDFRRRSARTLVGEGRRHGLAGRTGDACRAHRRDPRSRRVRRSAQRRTGRDPSAHRSPPPALRRAPRRGTRSGARIRARHQLQPRLPARLEGAEALDAPAFRHDLIRVPGTRCRSRDPATGDGCRLAQRQGAGVAPREAAQRRDAGACGRALDAARRVGGAPDPGRRRAAGSLSGGTDRTAHGRSRDCVGAAGPRRAGL